MKINPIRFSGEIKPWCMYGWFEKIFQIELKGDFPSVDRMGFNTRTHSHPRVKYKYLFGMFGKFGIYQICGDGHWKWFGLWLPMHNLKVSIRVAGSRKLGGLARNLEFPSPVKLANPCQSRSQTGYIYNYIYIYMYIYLHLHMYFFIYTHRHTKKNIFK